MAESPNQRLKRRLESLGKTYDEIAEETGIPRRTWQRQVEEGKSIKSDYLVTLWDTYGIDPDEILLGAPKDAQYRGVTIAKDREIDFAGLDQDPEFTIVPFYNVAAEAGGGLVAEEKEPLPFAFRSYWVKNVLRLNPKDLFVMKVAGDSMYPTLQAGDTILVDQSQTKASIDDIYIIRLDDLYRAKRIQHLPSGKLQISSDNDLYSPVTINPAEDEIEIVGRVVWFARAKI